MGKYGGASGAKASSGVKSQDAQVRDARREVEQQGGFDWTPVVLLGVMGATALFSFDRAYQKHEQRKEEEEQEGEENRRRREDDEKQWRRRRRRDEDDDRRMVRRGASEERKGSRARSLDEWDDVKDKKDVDAHGFYEHRGRRGRSSGYDRDYYDRDYDRYDRGYSADYHDRYDRYGGSSRRGQSTW